MAELQTLTAEHAAAASALNEPEATQRPARLAAYAGVGLIILGLLALYLGYDGAATHALPAAQNPYIISGGLLGAALIVLGGIGIALFVILQIQAKFMTELRATREAMEQLGVSLARQGVSSSAVAASTNGHVYVARGASSYHRSECRLVERADSVRPVAKEDASSAGLAPCRICKP